MLSFLLLFTFAQVLPESPTGWAGWAGFLSSGGVLTWFLLKYLPDVHRREETKDKLHREHIQVIVAEHAATIRTLTSAFTENIRDARAELRETIDLFRKEQRESRHDSRDVLNAILLRHDEQFKELATAIRTDFETIAEKLSPDNLSKE